jgi:phage-related minor tail protein
MPKKQSSTPLGAAVQSSLDGASQALSAFVGGPVTDATSAINDAVSKSFASVANTISAAALSGQTSITQMVDSILSDFDRVSLGQFVSNPVSNVVNSLVSSILPVSGARAAGGPVAAGSAYLVGEQGPELFVPGSSGSIAPNQSLQPQRPAITLNVQARDAQSFLKSQTQVAAMMARAIARGQRNM